MSAHPYTWSDAQPTVAEALEFSDLGLPGSRHPVSYERALRVLAAEVRRLQTPAQETCECCTPQRKCPDHGAALTSNDD